MIYFLLQSRVSECQHRVNDLIDLRLCSDGVKVSCCLQIWNFFGSNVQYSDINCTLNPCAASMYQSLKKHIFYPMPWFYKVNVKHMRQRVRTFYNEAQNFTNHCFYCCKQSLKQLLFFLTLDSTDLGIGRSHCGICPARTLGLNLMGTNVE